MNRCKAQFRLFACGLLALQAAPAVANPTASDFNHGLSVEVDRLNDVSTLSWRGVTGETYFIQVTPDLTAGWEYIDYIYPGAGAVLAHGFAVNTDTFFYRLKYSDQPTTDPWNDDFDGDDISNQAELHQDTDPLAFDDLDANGIPDDWELFWDSEIAVFPAPLELVLDWGEKTTKTLYLNNPTISTANYSLAITGDTVAGYSWEDSLTGTVAYIWTDISSTGTLMTAISDVDDDSQLITLSQFTFPYYGSSYSEVWVSSNGYLNFKAEFGDSSNEPFPEIGQPYGIIAPFWDDLHTGEAGDIYFKEEATRLIVQFEAVKHDSYTGTNSFQVILNANGSIEFHYKEMGSSYLESSSVGIENTVGNQGIQLRYNTDSSNQIAFQDNYAVRFNPTKTLYTLTPLSGSAPAGGPTEIVASFNTANVLPGTYTGSIVFTHDGTGTSPWNVPVEVRVPYAKITEPVSGHSLFEGDSLSSSGVMLRAKFVDTSTPIDYVEFRYEDTTILADGLPSLDEYQRDWPNVPAGNHNVYARVVLDNGQTNDSAPVEIRVIPDADEDRMDDRWEDLIVRQTNNDSLHSIEIVKALADFDGDGFPNIFEYHHGTDPVDPNSKPVFSAAQNTTSPVTEIGPVDYFIVDGLSNTAFEKSTIQAAVSAADDFDIIEVLPGIYEEEIDLHDRVYLFAREGARATIIDGTNAFSTVVDLYSASVVQGFTIRNGGQLTTPVTGAGVRVNLPSQSEARIVGCLLRDNIGHRYGGAIYIDYGKLVIESSTLSENQAPLGPAVYLNSPFSSIRIVNSLLWNPGSGFGEIRGHANGVELVGSIVRDEFSGNVRIDGVDRGTSDIGLTPWLGLYSNSPAVNAGVLPPQPPIDMDGELVADGAPDSGVDQFLDLDADGMADSWEAFYSLSDPSVDPDSDNLTNLQEYTFRTNPQFADTDGDLIEDGDEILGTLTDPNEKDTHALDGDRNNDGLDDGIGVGLGIAYGQIDSDGDGVSNEDERSRGTNPFAVDTDGDGENDSIDPFPLDHALNSSDFGSNPSDSTAPAFLLTKPVEAIEI